MMAKSVNVGADYFVVYQKTTSKKLGHEAFKA